jgi:hypothetical protein
MHEALMIVLGTALVGAAALAQNAGPRPDPTHNSAANSAASKPNAGGATQPQPQGRTGPTNTTSGGAPASSPQGDTPSGMQPRPHDPKQGIEKK